MFVANLAGVCSKAMAMDRFANFSEEVTEGRRSARADDERVERSGWTVNN